MLAFETTVRSGFPRHAIRFIAVAAIGFYAATAHLTRGHEADFGKQWLAARLVASGQGKYLFDLASQRAELELNYDSAVIDRGIWREGIGGPTYPPPLAILLSPLGWLTPRWAQWTIVELSVVAVVMTAWLLQRLTGGRVTWEIATIATLSMPSFFLAMGVGQNSAFNLLILVAGLSLIANDRDFMAGLVWGLFVYKPTWGMALAWLPAVLGRPRTYLGMSVTGFGLVALSLPLCGIGAWRDWFQVARQTELYYQSLPRWTALSRDLPGLLRRIDQGRHVELAGWAFVLVVLAATAWTWRRHGCNQPFQRFGRATVALLAGAILSCPRFMFYDMTLAVVPVLVGLADWNAMGNRARWAFTGTVIILWLGTAYEYVHWSMVGPPLDTFALVGLWCWAIAGCALNARARAADLGFQENRGADRTFALSKSI